MARKLMPAPLMARVRAVVFHRRVVFGIPFLWLLLFVQMAQTIGWPVNRGMATIWIAHTTFCSAYVAVVVSARLREVDRSIEEAAMDLGCTPLKTFFVITLPVIASFVSGPGATTLPMVVFSSVRMGVSPKINALAALIILAVSLIAFIAWYLMWRAEKRRRGEA